MLADELDYVIGVDTHRDEHALAVVDCPSGASLGEALISADGRGYAGALAFAAERAPGRRALDDRGHRLLRQGPKPLPR
jgi:transposase